MINEERIKEMFRLNLREQMQSREDRLSQEYYYSDFALKELMKSFFFGTILFLGIGGIIAAYFFEEILHFFVTAEIRESIIRIVLLYLLFQTVYLTVSYLWIYFRYKKAGDLSENVQREVKALSRMYKNDQKAKNNE